MEKIKLLDVNVIEVIRNAMLNWADFLDRKNAR